ncbi:hypothetical protein COCON_G00041460, partial [Conger conger]
VYSLALAAVSAKRYPLRFIQKGTGFLRYPPHSTAQSIPSSSPHSYWCDADVRASLAPFCIQSVASTAHSLSVLLCLNLLEFLSLSAFSIHVHQKLTKGFNQFLFYQVGK